jgi:hypothetical protein
MIVALAVQDAVTFSQEPNDNDYPSRIATLADGGYVIDVAPVARLRPGRHRGPAFRRWRPACRRRVPSQRQHVRQPGVGGFSVTGLTTGGFVVTWHDDAALDDGDGSSVRAQVSRRRRDAVGAEFRVNTSTARHQINPVVTALEDGRFVVAWLDFGR